MYFINIDKITLAFLTNIDIKKYFDYYVDKYTLHKQDVNVNNNSNDLINFILFYNYFILVIQCNIVHNSNKIYVYKKAMNIIIEERHNIFKNPKDVKIFLIAVNKSINKLNDLKTTLSNQLYDLIDVFFKRGSSNTGDIDNNYILLIIRYLSIICKNSIDSHEKIVNLYEYILKLIENNYNINHQNLYNLVKLINSLEIHVANDYYINKSSIIDYKLSIIKDKIDYGKQIKYNINNKEVTSKNYNKKSSKFIQIIDSEVTQQEINDFENLKKESDELTESFKNYMALKKEVAKVLYKYYIDMLPYLNNYYTVYRAVLSLRIKSLLNSANINKTVIKDKTNILKNVFIELINNCKEIAVFLALYKDSFSISNHLESNLIKSKIYILLKKGIEQSNKYKYSKEYKLYLKNYSDIKIATDHGYQLLLFYFKNIFSINSYHHSTSDYIFPYSGSYLRSEDDYNMINNLNLTYKYENNNVDSNKDNKQNVSLLNTNYSPNAINIKIVYIINYLYLTISTLELEDNYLIDLEQMVIYCNYNFLYNLDNFINYNNYDISLIYKNTYKLLLSKNPNIIDLNVNSLYFGKYFISKNMILTMISYFRKSICINPYMTEFIINNDYIVYYVLYFCQGFDRNSLYDIYTSVYKCLDSTINLFKINPDKYHMYKYILYMLDIIGKTCPNSDIVVIHFKLCIKIILLSIKNLPMSNVPMNFINIVYDSYKLNPKFYDICNNKPNIYVKLLLRIRYRIKKKFDNNIDYHREKLKTDIINSDMMFFEDYDSNFDSNEFEINNDID